MSDIRRRERAESKRPLAIARHGRQRRSKAWKTLLGFLGGFLVVALVSGGSVAAIAGWSLNQKLQENTVTTIIDEQQAPVSIAEYDGGFNILIVGSDTRQGQDGLGGSAAVDGGTLNDVTMMLHVAENQKSATLVSFPRDLFVPIPACKNGGPASSQKINTALYYGGLDCVVRTVQDLTGSKIQFAGLITFQGVVAMTNAVGGVPVCVTDDIDDPLSNLHITKGTHKIKGKTALAFLRSRHGVGDGSDLSRIASQQVYLSSLVRTLKSSDTLNDPSKLYQVALAATENISLTKNFAKLDTLVSIALVLKKVPLENITMVQYPSTLGGGGVQASVAQATKLFDAINSDKAIKLSNGEDGNHSGSVADPNAPEATPSATPTDGATSSPDDDVDSVTIGGVPGQSADEYTCSQKYAF